MKPFLLYCNNGHRSARAEKSAITNKRPASLRQILLESIFLGSAYRNCGQRSQGYISTKLGNTCKTVRFIEKSSSLDPSGMFAVPKERYREAIGEAIASVEVETPRY